MRFDGNALEMGHEEVRSLLEDGRQQAPALFSAADLAGLSRLYAHVMLSSLVEDPLQVVYTLWLNSGKWQARLAPSLYADVLYGPTLALSRPGRAELAHVWILDDERPALLEVEVER